MKKTVTIYVDTEDSAVTVSIPGRDEGSEHSVFERAAEA
jgi:hypothetical protein